MGFSQYQQGSVLSMQKQRFSMIIPFPFSSVIMKHKQNDKSFLINNSICL